MRLTELPQLAQIRDRAQLDNWIAAAKQKNELRKLYAWGMFAVVIIQLVVADAVFLGYVKGAGRPKGVAIDPTALEVFLGATVVQIIGIVLVITKNLFPEDSKT